MSLFLGFPPEVWSSLLNGGPGPGSLFAGSGALREQSASYLGASDKAAEILAKIDAGLWHGDSALQFQAKHGDLVPWLAEVAGIMNHAAESNEFIAFAFIEAAAMMPTMAELLANHVSHAILVATNFLGINTIPIAINEAQYVEMWIRAAETMSTYESVVNGILDSTTPLQYVKPLIFGNGSVTADATRLFENLVLQYTNQEDLLSPTHGLLNDIELINKLVKDAVFSSLVGLPVLTLVVSWVTIFSIIGYPTWTFILLSPFLIPALALGASIGIPVGVGVGVGVGAPLVLNNVSLPQVAVPVPAPAPAAVMPAIGGAPASSAGMSTSAVSTPTAPAAPSVPSAPAPSVGSVAPAPTAPPVTGAAPSAGFGAFNGAFAGEFNAAAAFNFAARDEEEEDTAASAAAAGAALDDAAADVANRLEVELGFAGTTAKDGITDPLGMSRMKRGAFGTAPSRPMVPSTWQKADSFTTTSHVSSQRADKSRFHTAEGVNVMKQDKAKATMAQEKM